MLFLRGIDFPPPLILPQTENTIKPTLASTENTILQRFHHPNRNGIFQIKTVQCIVSLQCKHLDTDKLNIQTKKKPTKNQKTPTHEKQHTHS